MGVGPSRSLPRPTQTQARTVGRPPRRPLPGYPVAHLVHASFREGHFNRGGVQRIGLDETDRDAVVVECSSRDGEAEPPCPDQGRDPPLGSWTRTARTSALPQQGLPQTPVFWTRTPQDAIVAVGRGRDSSALPRTLHGVRQQVGEDGGKFRREHRECLEPGRNPVLDLDLPPARPSASPRRTAASNRSAMDWRERRLRASGETTSTRYDAWRSIHCERSTAAAHASLTRRRRSGESDRSSRIALRPSRNVCAAPRSAFISCANAAI